MGENGEAGGERNAEEDSFHKPAYWQTFYEDFDEDELYDWYSSVEWLAENVAILARELGVAADEVSVLDVGCGTSPLLFELAQQHGMRRLRGIDFSPSAIDRCRAAADNDDSVADVLRFDVVDAKDMSCFKAESFDIVCDKGCLDCFVSGDGQHAIVQYFAEVARVLRPNGRFAVIAVNGADIPHLIATAQIIPDAQAGASKQGARTATWQQRKKVEMTDKYEPVLFVHAVRARDDKHLYICGKSPPAEPVQHLTCDMCDAQYPFPVGFPETCHACQCRLQRFALS